MRGGERDVGSPTSPVVSEVESIPDTLDGSGSEAGDEPNTQTQVAGILDTLFGEGDDADLLKSMDTTVHGQGDEQSLNRKGGARNKSEPSRWEEQASSYCTEKALEEDDEDVLSLDGQSIGKEEFAAASKAKAAWDVLGEALKRRKSARCRLRVEDLDCKAPVVRGVKRGAPHHASQSAPFEPPRKIARHASRATLRRR